MGRAGVGRNCLPGSALSDGEGHGGQDPVTFCSRLAPQIVRPCTCGQSLPATLNDALRLHASTGRAYLALSKVTVDPQERRKFLDYATAYADFAKQIDEREGKAQ